MTPDRETKGSTPVPDPTLLTTQQLIREMLSLRELLESKLGGFQTATDAHLEIIGTRIDGMDRAIRLLQDISDKFPERIDEKINALRGVHAEKFDSVQTQFKERDVRSEQTQKDSKVAVDAALQAAKEAVGVQQQSNALAIAKSETATIKQIDQMGLLIQTGSKATDDKINDLKERLTRLEGGTTGRAAGGASTIALVSIIVAIAAVAVSVIMAFRG